MESGHRTARRASHHRSWLQLLSPDPESSFWLMQTLGDNNDGSSNWGSWHSHGDCSSQIAASASLSCCEPFTQHILSHSHLLSLALSRSLKEGRKKWYFQEKETLFMSHSSLLWLLLFDTCGCPLCSLFSSGSTVTLWISAQRTREHKLATI